MTILPNGYEIDDNELDSIMENLGKVFAHPRTYKTISNIHTLMFKAVNNPGHEYSPDSIIALQNFGLLDENGCMSEQVANIVKYAIDRMMLRDPRADIVQIS